MKLILSTPLILVSLCLTGCAHRDVPVESVPGPNGETVYEADCGGTGSSFGDCMRAAAKTCPSARYEIISKDAQSSFYSFHRGEVSPIIERNMLFRCLGAKDEKLPSNNAPDEKTPTVPPK